MALRQSVIQLRRATGVWAAAWWPMASYLYPSGPSSLLPPCAGASGLLQPENCRPFPRDNQGHSNMPWMARGYKAQGNEIRQGNILEFDGKLYQVTKYEYTQGQGRQLGNVHLVMKDITTGIQRLEKLRPAESVEVVRLQEKTFTFLYREGDIFFLMDPDTYEQISLDLDKLAGVWELLEEDTPLKVAFYQGEPVTGSLPKTVTLTIAEADPSIKGESAAGGSKGAVSLSGLQLKVPLYIQKGDKVVIDTASREFIKRV